MLPLVTRLEKSPTAQWHLRIRGVDGRGPERKRVEYYSALREWLGELGTGSEHTSQEARCELDRRTWHSSSSTLYNALKRRPVTDTMSPSELKSSLLAGNVITRLTAETKIWDHWAHRRGWLRGLTRTGTGHSKRFVATTLVRTLAAWAAEHPALAEADHHAPPLTAVQDLCIVFDGRIGLDDSHTLLSRVVEFAVGPLGAAPDTVVDAVYDDLMSLGFETWPFVSDALDRILVPLGELEYLLHRLPGDALDEVGRRLTPKFQEVMRLVARRGGG